jgi:hypothetical protein
MKSRRPRVRIWPAPIVIGVLSTIGLIAALLSDQSGDVLAWFTLAVPVAVALWFWMPRRATARESSEDRER